MSLHVNRIEVGYLKFQLLGVERDDAHWNNINTSDGLLVNLLHNELSI